MFAFVRFIIFYTFLCFEASFFSKLCLSDDLKLPKRTYDILYASSAKINLSTEKKEKDMESKNIYSFISSANLNEDSDDSVSVSDTSYKDNKDEHLKVNRANKYSSVFIFAGTGFGTSGFGINAGGNYKMFGIRFSAQTLKIKKLIKINDEVTLGLFNVGDYGIDFMFRMTSYLHMDIGFHYFKNIANVYYKNSEILPGIGLDGLLLNGNVDVKIGDKIVPYFGFGFNIRLFFQLYLDIDFGVILTGDYVVDKFTVCIEDSGGDRATIDLNPTFEDIHYITGYDAEKHNYKVWPIVKIGLSYRYNMSF